MELKYAFDPDSSFQKKLEEVYKATGDLTIPLILIAKSWYKSNRSIFKLTTAGQHYPDLSEKYKKAKLKRWGFVYPILKASGDLEKAITDAADDNAINYIVNKNTLVLGVSGKGLPYAIYHQSDQPRTKMPYRPFLFVGVEQIAPHDMKQARLKTWLQILDSHMQQSIDKKA